MIRFARFVSLLSVNKSTNVADVSSYLDAMIDLSSKSASVHIAKPVERLADSMNRLKLQSAETK